MEISSTCRQYCLVGEEHTGLASSALRCKVFSDTKELSNVAGKYSTTRSTVGTTVVTSLSVGTPTPIKLERHVAQRSLQLLLTADDSPQSLLSELRSLVRELVGETTVEPAVNVKTQRQMQHTLLKLENCLDRLRRCHGSFDGGGTSEFLQLSREVEAETIALLAAFDRGTPWTNMTHYENQIVQLVNSVNKLALSFQ
jgi:hypothetical protein